MKLPVDVDEWPQSQYLKWFGGKNYFDLMKSHNEQGIEQDFKFKQSLKQNVLKLITQVNRLFHEKIDAWHYMRPYRDYFAVFFKAAIRLALSKSEEFELTIADRYQLLTFFNYAFNSIEVDFVHEQIKKYLSLPIWFNLNQRRREEELSNLSKRIQLAWRRLEEQDKKMNASVLEEKKFERTFMINYAEQFLRILPDAVKYSSDTTSSDESQVDGEIALYCQRFIEFIIDLESQLPLRRFLHCLLEYKHFLVRCQLSDLAKHKSAEGHLFNQLIELLQLYTRYKIDIMTGEAFTEIEVMQQHEKDVLSLQRTIWSQQLHLRRYAIRPIRAIDNASALYEIITSFDSGDELFEFIKSLGLVDESSLGEDDRDNPVLLASILMNHYRRYEPQSKRINSIPLFPNESVIWDTNLVPDQYYNYEYPLALPKLNLQFLTMSDYLLRNFMLFKNESTYEIRIDLEDGITRSKCRWTVDGHFATGPKQRFALIIKDFSIIEVGKPRLGENCPSKVRAKVVINMDYVKTEWRKEWEQLRKHDTCFLVSFGSPSEKEKLGWPQETFPSKNSVKYVRGCEIESLLDSDGKVVDENLENPNFTNNLRTFMVFLDCNQYQMDQDTYNTKKLAIYDKFHLMIRRKPEKNNFKGVLETIRSLINTKFVVPDWLRDLLIGFGDPRSAHYTNLGGSRDVMNLDYYDTFLDYSHLQSSFSSMRPDYSLVVANEANTMIEPPFRVEINDSDKWISVNPYKILSRGPYPADMPKKNSIRFTPSQVEAITSGMQHGLTLVVGPPGTGKTDVAVQILSNLYHSFPDQRTLIVTHSNQALNQIFEKMIELDVKEHHLLRMGHGEEDLDSNCDFSRRGRVKHVLSKKMEYLVLVTKLARSLGLDPGQGLTCQSSEYFRSYHIIPRWEEFNKLVACASEVGDIGDKFPFSKFFEDAPQPLFKRQSIEEDLEIARGCFRYMEEIFESLRAFKPFEIFSSGSDRSKYLLIREAKVIAMTCTHAGLRRKELVELNFQYDNILMEETAQILEIETTIPLLLQNPENGVNRLKRWIMIGDHNQLPPIIQNSAFQKFSNMEQSLFARFVRLGVPSIELDAQGRARPSLCDLYRWRYKNLRDLDLISENEEFKRANAGFLFDYQLIDVEDGSESTPMPYFYQNRSEAEYVLALYKFMLSIGYPADKITILTTYNGQKELLNDLFMRQFNTKSNSTGDRLMAKMPRITTVDKYQGLQNDFILLSLVRTRNVGHVRDIRRLVVAMSRARLGLYVFARASLFGSSFELRHSMQLFQQRPSKLHLLPGELYPSSRMPQSSNNTEQMSTSHVKVVQSVRELLELCGCPTLAAGSGCEQTN